MQVLYTQPPHNMFDTTERLAPQQVQRDFGCIPLKGPTPLKIGKFASDIPHRIKEFPLPPAPPPSPVLTPPPEQPLVYLPDRDGTMMPVLWNRVWPVPPGLLRICGEQIAPPKKKVLPCPPAPPSSPRPKPRLLAFVRDLGIEYPAGLKIACSAMEESGYTDATVRAACDVGQGSGEALYKNEDEEEVGEGADGDLPGQQARDGGEADGMQADGQAHGSGSVVAQPQQEQEQQQEQQEEAEEEWEDEAPEQAEAARPAGRLGGGMFSIGQAPLATAVGRGERQGREGRARRGGMGGRGARGGRGRAGRAGHAGRA